MGRDHDEEAQWGHLCCQVQSLLKMGWGWGGHHHPLITQSAPLIDFSDFGKGFFLFPCLKIKTENKHAQVFEGTGREEVGKMIE